MFLKLGSRWNSNRHGRYEKAELASIGGGGGEPRNNPLITAESPWGAGIGGNRWRVKVVLNSG